MHLDTLCIGIAGSFQCLQSSVSVVLWFKDGRARLRILVLTGNKWRISICAREEKAL
ncbi:uncharacterized protein BT62DRAFT_937208 [Guyanagaster necrorhizus]|uniref:Uncharacterized protein n=1 Tax=Guyanagaster necrorhizus TaxID=856835 RepID=A0A9P8AN19_9AGAR|nr:uncharacterized protein BT62DRAFT_937208 [Guyanagaster necrorhizus MCA 3950]KAG7441440.1 hypothetical protein BT62DRAFT_937208 [Guyanagaster necrorhizus MCA 3950]